MSPKIDKKWTLHRNILKNLSLNPLFCKLGLFELPVFTNLILNFVYICLICRYLFMCDFTILVTLFNLQSRIAFYVPFYLILCSLIF